MTDTVSFYLNGERVTLENPAPDLLLIDYLRSPDVGLTGAKKGCGQGGCGACTVILSTRDAGTGEFTHRSINSCLRPVCSLDGLALTTIEGTGETVRPAPEHLAHQLAYSRTAAPAVYVTSREADAAKAASQSRAEARTATARALDDVSPEGELTGMNPVAYRLAANNGTQCGYCTTGFVMNMCALLDRQPSPTKRQIEDAFDGNLCRCTGYRPILTGLETFADDWTPVDEEHRMKCLTEEALSAMTPAAGARIPLPPDDGPAPGPHRLVSGGRVWVRPATLAELGALLREFDDMPTRMVNGNTSYGVYPDEVRAAEVLIDIQLVPELLGHTVGEQWADVGAATTYSELIELLDRVRSDRDLAENTAVGAMWLMSRRTAGTIVRNAATLAGNTMLVLAHVEDGEPFPSDLLTTLVAVGAEVTVWQALTDGEPRRLPLAELVGEVLADPACLRGLVILRYHLPLVADDDEAVFAQKVALRDVNAHSLVNVTTALRLDGTVVEAATVVFGGIAPVPWHAEATEERLRSGPLSLDDFPLLAATLRDEVRAELSRWRDRMASVPWEGITDTYRVDLAVSFLYKAIVNALVAFSPESVPPRDWSAGVSTWGRWPLSGGRQSYVIQDWKAPVSQPYIKLMAFYQATGKVTYTHETPVSPRAVNAAFVQSRMPLADYHFRLPHSEDPVDRAVLAEFLTAHRPGFVALVGHEELPDHGINLQGMGGDQPLLAQRRVSYVGQAIALVVAETEQQAHDIAAYVTERCVGYAAVDDWPPEWRDPVLSIEQAIELGSVFPDYPKSASFNSHIWRITRPDSDLSWSELDDPLDRAVTVRSVTVDGIECVVVGNTQSTGGQAHFYLETQACVVEPMDGDRWRVVPSTQSPMEMHQTAAMALGVEYHRVEVDVPQVGGGYGGKTEQARFVVGPALVAANALDRPVRLVLPRDADTAMIGKRHAVYGRYQVAIDRTGLLHGLDTAMWADGGAFYDCSFIVTNCLQLRADNAYQVANFRNQIDVCRTNKAPSTAFRSFGDVQGKLITENAIDDAAFAAGLDPVDVREKNLYKRGDVTPFGQSLTYCYMREVWSYLREKSRYDERRARVATFNRENRWRKQGIAMMPVKYGSGYNLVQLEQAAVHVAVYAGDGSVVIHQGGVEMGQGLTTRVEQVASYVLNVPFDLLRIELPNTGVVPNPTSTGASTGTSYSAEAVKQACERLRGRLVEFGYRMLEENGPDWCCANQIDFWNYGKQGWATPLTNPVTNTTRLIWQNLVQVAYQQRVDLVVSGTVPMTGGEDPVPALTYKPMAEQHDIPGVEVDRTARPGGAVDQFCDFTYSAACATVEVDILTGEVKVLSADIAYDIGWSLNPALDIGQVEGAFVQGIGYVLTEDLVFQPAGTPGEGRLNTVNTWRYKPPAVTTIPLEFNTHLFPRDLAADVPENPANVLSAKEVGEPPLVLATSVFLAVKDAVRASRLERGLDGLFRMDAPATVQEVRRACAVDLSLNQERVS
ncbi:molybdopterin cofactor-binding domain-containing protein [Actinophytocola algeriensis]|uniref:Xanthine dehydrogenase/oxidase n=1 Tax=Actinophytocola algeriensis TaxID=1768010 RepID=A0A7W7QEU7_9PSEU|nr:molybdopterin cofactor-binding domain-containing protein [Actinophytocola algeriensis]MBB4912295.1 xanthine dehydrogenase/oxidase [Actinophytocola algeriensis]MBE1474189.1 xanthine dehydrogenase/oxidase [Actinophytocola algeriensis]